MVSYGPLISNMVLYGPIWSHMVMYGPVWSLMVPFGPVWSLMVPYGPVWFRIVPYGPLWSFMVPYGSIWSCMVPYGPIWSHIVPYGPKWSRREEIATSSAANTRKSKRLMLAMLLEEYFTLFSDQNIRLGHKSLMILTLLAHASSEINWLVVHQNDPRITVKKRETESLRTGQETIMIRYYLVRIRDLIKENEAIMKAYFVEALKQEDTKDIAEMMEQLDLKREDISLVKKILANIQKIEIIKNENGMTIERYFQRKNKSIEGTSWG